MSFGYAEVAARAEHRCEYCHAPEALANFPFFVDHIAPRVLAPELTSYPENLALACPPCNLHKADRTYATDPDSGTSVRLFHPRRDRWRDHFRWDEDGAILRGITPQARATIVALQLNSPAQCRARAFWLTTDFFP